MRCRSSGPGPKYFRAFHLLYPAIPFGLSLVLLALGILTGDAGAQTSCYQTECLTACTQANGGNGSCPNPLTSIDTFPQNSAITVNIDPAWRNINGVDMTNCIVSAFSNWQGVPRSCQMLWKQISLLSISLMLPYSLHAANISPPGSFTLRNFSA